MRLKGASFEDLSNSKIKSEGISYGQYDELYLKIRTKATFLDEYEDGAEVPVVGSDVEPQIQLLTCQDEKGKVTHFVIVSQNENSHGTWALYKLPKSLSKTIT